ncbi:hypothetical protein [Synechococcus sp. BIOS-E4-1]|uniref:hypothetical protein n=1 Tax=Synechococcus sp. BIOS-E4-1 TaxID=1400864 RepID=UPI0016495AB9|nr:hypothetical protein [Synechococcus sp. BIOS-E4-1]
MKKAPCRNGQSVPHPLASLIRSLSQTSLLVAAGLGMAAPARPAVSVPVECRQQHQEWQNCRYESDQPGRSWQLAFENNTVRFYHDGSGRMKMQLNDNGDWTGVQARWIAERTLCWNDVCARGEIPLD